MSSLFSAYLSKRHIRAIGDSSSTSLDSSEQRMRAKYNVRNERRSLRAGEKLKRGERRFWVRRWYFICARSTVAVWMNKKRMKCWSTKLSLRRISKKYNFNCKYRYCRWSLVNSYQYKHSNLVMSAIFVFKEISLWCQCILFSISLCIDIKREREI